MTSLYLYLAALILTPVLVIVALICFTVWLNHREWRRRARRRIGWYS